MAEPMQSAVKRVLVPVDETFARTAVTFEVTRGSTSAWTGALPGRNSGRVGAPISAASERQKTPSCPRIPIYASSGFKAGSPAARSPRRHCGMWPPSPLSCCRSGIFSRAILQISHPSESSSPGRIPRRICRRFPCRVTTSNRAPRAIPPNLFPARVQTPSTRAKRFCPSRLN